MLAHQASATDLLFITLRKSEVLLFVREHRKQDGRPGAPPNPSCAWGLPAMKATRANAPWRGGISVAAGAGDSGGVDTSLLVPAYA